MNRFILKHKYAVTFAILAILAWVAYKRFSAGGSGFITFVVVAAIVWGLGTFVFIYYWPPITFTAFKRAITHGVDANTSSGIPINTLYAVPTIAVLSASSASILTTGTDYLLYVLGWLDLSKGAQVLHVPDFSGRYYSVQFIDIGRRCLCLCRHSRHRRRSGRLSDFGTELERAGTERRHADTLSEQRGCRHRTRARGK